MGRSEESLHGCGLYTRSPKGHVDLARADRREALSPCWGTGSGVLKIHFAGTLGKSSEEKGNDTHLFQDEDLNGHHQAGLKGC